MTAGLAAGVLIAIVVPIVLITVILAPACKPAGGDAGAIAGGKSIPRGFYEVFNEAARVYSVNPYLLASVAYQESTFGTGPGWDRVNYAGCVGFMQTCVGGQGGNSWGSTIALKGGPVARIVDKQAYTLGNRPLSYSLMSTVHPSYNDAFDAVMAAAVELRGKVGGKAIPQLDDTARQALCGYYGACGDSNADYASSVLDRAQGYAKEDISTAVRAAAPTPPVGGGKTSSTARNQFASLTTTTAAGASGAASSQRMIWPVNPHPITQGYCVANDHESCHPGMDIGAPNGTQVHAVLDGIVSLNQPEASSGGYGNYLCLRHSPKLTTCYGHMQTPSVWPAGAPVPQGTVLGLEGSTGNSSGPHLHFEVRLGPDPRSPTTQPLDYLGKDISAITGVPSGTPGSSECPQNNTGSDQAVAAGGGELGYPLGARAALGQGSNTQGGTHDPTIPPNNWQSDNALDLLTPVGTPVLAVADGVICPACGFGTLGTDGGPFNGMRFTLNIKGNRVFYTHLSRFIAGLHPGQQVTRGQILGYSGEASGVEHLHVAFQTGKPETLLGFQ